jgi:hypothetical protein
MARQVVPRRGGEYAKSNPMSQMGSKPDVRAALSESSRYKVNEKVALHEQRWCRKDTVAGVSVLKQLDERRDVRAAIAEKFVRTRRQIHVHHDFVAEGDTIISMVRTCNPVGCSRRRQCECPY